MFLYLYSVDVRTKVTCLHFENVIHAAESVVLNSPYEGVAAEEQMFLLNSDFTPLDVWFQFKPSYNDYGVHVVCSPSSALL